jgi:hypothetical protein
MVGTVKKSIPYSGCDSRGRIARSATAACGLARYIWFAGVDAEFEEFAVDARRSPKQVVAAHPANQFASLDRYAGATATP